MFVGHYAAALAAKKLAPKTSLGVLVLAAQWIDLLWPLFLLLGWEHVAIDPGNTRVTPLNFYDYPLSHSLLMVLLWAILLGGAYWLVSRSRRASLVVGALVLSHWVLDWISHRPDMPLNPGRTAYVGLGLWNHPAVNCAVEFGGLALGLWLYWTVARRVVRPAVFWPLIALIVVIGASVYVGNTPPSVRAIAWSALLLWPVALWAWASERATGKP